DCPNKIERILFGESFGIFIDEKYQFRFVMYILRIDRKRNLRPFMKKRAGGFKKYKWGFGNRIIKLVGVLNIVASNAKNVTNRFFIMANNNVTHTNLLVVFI